MQSTLRTRPAPREIHTENLSVLRPASLASAACFHLYQSVMNHEFVHDYSLNLPTIGKNTPVKPPEKKVEEEFTSGKLLLY